MTNQECWELSDKGCKKCPWRKDRKKCVRLKDLNEDTMLDLVELIVHSAAEDYRYAKIMLRRNPNDEGNQRLYRECRRFFESDYFCDITNLDGEEMLSILDGKGEY